jgi:hypothetical protein
VNQLKEQPKKEFNTDSITSNTYLLAWIPLQTHRPKEKDLTSHGTLQHSRSAHYITDHSTMAGFGQALSKSEPHDGGNHVEGEEAQMLVPTEAPTVTKPETPSGLPMLAGFELWVAPTPNVFSSDNMPIFEILGTDAQIVQFPIRAGRAIMCFSGAMAYMSDGMTMKVELAGLAKAFGRLAGGGSLFQLIYTNETAEDGYIAFTPDYPGVIVPINMQSCPSGKIVAMRDSFLCSTIGLGDVMTDVGAGFNPANSVGGFCCNGVDFIVQTVSNGEWAFLMVRIS